MPKRKSTKEPKQRPSDVNQLAHLLVRESTEEEAAGDRPSTRSSVSKTISRVMAQMGSKGGRIGGKRRLVTMTQEQRRQVAADAAKARWAKAKKPR